MHDPRTSRELPEREWFDTPYSLEELEAQYQDPTSDKQRREHAFYRYWRRFVAERDRMSRPDLERLLEHVQWIQPIGDIIQALGSRDGLDQDDVQWLLAALPVESYAHHQLAALALLRDAAIPWEEKLQRLLESNVDWAKRRVVELLPIEEAERAQEIIAESRSGKGMRNQLLRILHERVDAVARGQ